MISTPSILATLSLAFVTACVASSNSSRISTPKSRNEVASAKPSSQTLSWTSESQSSVDQWPTSVGDVNVDLLAVARDAIPVEISTREIAENLQDAPWNENRDAVALSIRQPNPEPTCIVVLLKQPDGQFIAADASGIEGANLGFLCTTQQSGYPRFETMPVEWTKQSFASEDV